MSAHAGPPRPVIDGECTWRHHHEDVHLWCDERAIPGSDECATHLIQRVHEAAARAEWRRWFPQEAS